MAATLRSEAQRPSYTGRTRRRRTRWSVRLIDSIARWLITIGGIGTIAAVLTVCFFLVYQVAPLFFPGTVSEVHSTQTTFVPAPRLIACDSSAAVAWSIPSDLAQPLRLISTHSGAVLREVPWPDGWTPTCIKGDPSGYHVAVGLADGRCGMLTLDFREVATDGGELPAEIHSAPPEAIVPWNDAWLMKQADGTLLALQCQPTFGEPRAVCEPAADGSPRSVRLVDVAPLPNGEAAAALAADNSLWLSTVTRTRNMLTRKETMRGKTERIDLELPAQYPPADHLLLSDLASSVLLIWNDGRLLRYRLGDVAGRGMAEDLEVVPEPARLTSVTWLVGRNTLLVGDSAGRVQSWFLTQPEGTETIDGARLTAAHQFAVGQFPITCLASAPARRLLAVGDAAGHLRLYHATSEKLLFEVPPPATAPSHTAPSSAAPNPASSAVVQAALSPAGERCCSLRADGTLTTASATLGYPGASLSSLFRAVWYESYPEPSHTWQSSQAGGTGEPKLGFWPLIFGTLKATTYSMLFAVPIALAAAVYTSEFLKPRLKARVKPVIELMASLPSVVLGYLGALVLAPYIENIVLQLLLCFVCLPASVALAGVVWQFVPASLRLRLAPARLLLIACALVAGLAAARVAGPWCESRFFQGDFRGWLSAAPDSSHALGGWLLIGFPWAVVAAMLLSVRFVTPWVRQRTAGASSSTRVAAWELAKLLIGALLALTLAYAGSSLLAGAGYDPRGSFFGKYDKDNSLVVGLVMGFAIIPLIYTIAEDALASVPQHLRTASLGAGATAWQTALLIVIPTATSGLFSAVMVGLGRAVGETMIVLMAGGGTPIIDANIFNGFRTLSATIAIEIGEATPGGTLYRVLFLAALTLFAMTFAINTLAEVVRQRYRRRAYQL